MKTGEITFRMTLCPDKHLCFLLGKSHPTMLRGLLQGIGYPICYDLPLFETIHTTVPFTIHYSQLSAIQFSKHLSSSACFGLPSSKRTPPVGGHLPSVPGVSAYRRFNCSQPVSDYCSYRQQQTRCTAHSSP